MNYQEFINQKSQLNTNNGFDPIWIPDFLFDFQKSLTDWALRIGRAGIFADCGLGKTPMQLVWAENVVRKTNKKVLILTPLAVSYQTIQEGKKFDIDCERSHGGTIHKNITITNYEQLHKFNAGDFAGVVCDESSILKNFDGARKTEITEFMKKIPYRLLATATAAPNDYIELGTSSEALGYLGFIDMLTRYFKNDNNNVGLRRMFGEAPKWRFKGHSEASFWRWVTSWARACRRPSDLGFEDNGFILPDLIVKERCVKDVPPPDGMLFTLPALRLDEQRDEVRRTVAERCEMAASLVLHTKQPAIIWCHLNEEGRLLKRLITDSVEISGTDSDDKKESKFISFLGQESRVLITKPKIGAWGLNFQHCNHVVYFPSHSYEQYYQAVRRCWRYGQKRPVCVDIILTEGEKRVMENLNRKSIQATKMFKNLVAEMNSSISVNKNREYNNQERIPSWLL